jgi:apolipoprotein N-acyltransferase
LAACVVLSRRPPAARRRDAAWAGGAGYFALTLHWIVEPFIVDAARHGWMAPFALVLLPAVSRFSGGRGRFGPPLGGRPPSSARWHSPPLLVLAEAGAGNLFTGFPWAFPGMR